MDNRYSVRVATPADAPSLPTIEQSAGAVFRGITELAWIADDDVQSVGRHLELIALGTAWVATDEADQPVAFLNAQAMGDALHIWEMSVHADHQRRGLGVGLLRAVQDFATSAGLAAMTLTTFRDVAWNDAFYRRCGFDVVPNDQLSEELRGILLSEVDAGLPRDRRCAMVMALGSPTIAAAGISG